MAEWGHAISQRPEPWEIVVSPTALEREGPLREAFAAVCASGRHAVTLGRHLHLSVSVRSPRAQRIADWADRVLALDLDAARSLREEAGDEFPVVLTRNAEAAREWLRDRGGVDHRYGLIASSGARRLRAWGLELSAAFRHGYPYEEWFLAERDDVRSAHALEVVASQFECQGLELDWAGLCWGGDLLIDPRTSSWLHRRFLGRGWQRVRDAAEQELLRNRYRVLLTRAREGLIIWVPPGREGDQTLAPAPYDATAELLRSAGVEEL